MTTTLPAKDEIADVIVKHAESFAPLVAGRQAFPGLDWTNTEANILMIEGGAQAAYLGGIEDTFTRRSVAFTTIRNGLTRLGDDLTVAQRDRIIIAIREAALGLV